jgi:hypothetical protein
MILKGRHRLLVVLGTLAAGALLMGTGPGWALGALPGAERVAQELQGARRAEVSLSTGVSRLNVRSSARADLLVDGAIQPRRGERIERSFSALGGVARFSASSAGSSIGGMFGNRGGTWDLLLSGRVPLTLRVDTGVGESILELSELRLEHLSLDTGVGATTVTLPTTGRFDAAIGTGVGAATVRLPRGLDARITVERGIGAVSVPSGFTRNGDVYLSPGFANAANRVELRVKSGVGAVEVVMVD